MKPAILSLIPKYSSSYIPKVVLTTFPQPLPLLHQPEYLDLQYHKLLKVCESVKVNITNDMAIAVERETRLQSNSTLWFKYRAGRVTASRMKAVCHTDASNPSQSLVKSISKLATQIGAYFHGMPIFTGPTQKHLSSLADKQHGVVDMRSLRVNVT